MVEQHCARKGDVVVQDVLTAFASYGAWWRAKSASCRRREQLQALMEMWKVEDCWIEADPITLWTRARRSDVLTGLGRVSRNFGRALEEQAWILFVHSL